ncbi:MAG: cupin domain-containing protein [Roseiarcus sp.]
MLTRRGFVGCALCALAGFSASDAGAQTPGLKRTLVARVDGPTPGYETVEMKIEIDAGTVVARHTHPGVETSYFVDGSAELTIEGLGTKTYGKGDTFQVPTGVIHGGKAGAAPVVISGVYVVEKGKPLTSPAPT